MCGIIGYVTNKYKQPLQTFLGQGLIVDSLRGMCGTGIFAWDPKEKESSVYKRALTGADFVNSEQFDLWKGNAFRHQVVIGHNRASTIGAAKDQNCHPFVYDHIGLVHNGTLRNHNSLFRAGEFSHAVDSAYAAKAFSVYGALEALPKIEGAFVFVWHDAIQNTFNIARNNMRDIWYITDKDGDNLYYASEYDMLAWLLDRNGIDTHGKYKSPAELTLLSWELDKPLLKPKVTAFEEYKPPKIEYYRGDHGRFKGRNRDQEDLEALGIDQFDALEIADWTFEPYNDGGRGQGKVIGHVRIGEGDKSKLIMFKLHNASQLDKQGLETADKKFVIANSLWYERNGQEQIPYIICRSFIFKSGTPEEAAEEDKLPVVADVFPGPAGTYFGKEAFIRLIAAGCCYCGEPLVPDHAKDLKWVQFGTDYQPICKACNENPKIMDELDWYKKEGYEPHAAHRYGYWD